MEPFLNYVGILDSVALADTIPYAVVSLDFKATI